jgi:undecaprenyl diphosphate synthase
MVEIPRVQHLACVMDGNRRYAQQQGWQPWIGHKHGIQAANMVTQFCLDQQIPYLSLYLFSLENFKRTQTEQQFLFSLLVEHASAQLDELIAKGIRVRFIGDRDQFPASVRAACERVEQETANGQALQVQLLFCYGGQQEIVAAARNLAAQVAAGTLHADAIDAQLFARTLWTGTTPEPDLIIRTGGVQRISNFLLYQSAYSEYYFTNTLWPELKQEELQTIVEQFVARKRNFGQ